MRIVALTPMTAVTARLKEAVGDGLHVAADEAAACAAMGGADALVIAVQDYSDAIGAAVRASESLRWVGLLSAGFDRIQRLGVRPGVVVTNAGDALTPSVAAHAVSLALAVQRGFPSALKAQARGVWDRSMQPRMTTPAESTCLIVGYGSIGQESGRLMKAFGAKIVGVSRSGRPAPHADEIYTVDRLDELLPQADTIILATPLDASTRGLISRARLALMKKTAILVNIARGAVLDQDALADALESGALGGAGIDVTEPEPLPDGHRLWSAPHLIISPHVSAACGPLLYRRIAEKAAENAAAFRDGAPLKYVVMRG